MASKRRDAPHLVAPIRRYATSKVRLTGPCMYLCSEPASLLASTQGCCCVSCMPQCFVSFVGSLTSVVLLPSRAQHTSESSEPGASCLKFTLHT